MRPIPVAFHIGPLVVHTYGIGLALTFWFGYRYFGRRLRRAGYPDQWLGGTFVWIVVAAVVGARLVHVLANLSAYRTDPVTVFEIWQGGLTSFGGLAFAIPVGLVSAHRRCPQLRASVAGDLVTPVLVAAWAVGRLLGPQLMVAGGGKRTDQWFGMYYADQAGRRLPVPIFQAFECAAIFLALMALERLLRRRGGPVGVVTAVGVGLWGISRFVDEYLWLPKDAGSQAIEVLGWCLFGLGMVAAVVLLGLGRRGRPPLTEHPRKEPDEVPDAVTTSVGE